MSVVLVTVTCPKCGGDVKGVDLSPQSTKIPCTYCGTELHVPQIGATPTPEPPHVRDGQRGKIAARSALKSKRVGWAIVGIATLCFVVAIVWGVGQSRENPMVAVDRNDQLRKKCQDECKEACQEKQPSGEFSGAKLERQLQNAKNTVCETECESTRQCWKGE